MLFLDARRTGYSPDQCNNTMTVRDLISFLEQFDEDKKVYLRHDNGYTYGAITDNDFKEDGESEEW